MYDEQVRMNRVKDKQSQRRTKVGKKTHMDKTLHPKFYMVNNMVISVYLSSLSVAHFSDAPRRRLVVTGDSARIQDEFEAVFKIFGNNIFMAISEPLRVLLASSILFKPLNVFT